MTAQPLKEDTRPDRIPVSLGRWSMIHYGINPVLFMVAISLAILMLSRIGLTLWQWEQIPLNKLYMIFLGGIRIDFASVCALFALPLLIITIISALPRLKLGTTLLKVLAGYCALAVSFLVLNECATPNFILEYGVRPNHIYVQYLVYPREVVTMLWQGHKVALLAVLTIFLISLLASYRMARWAFLGSSLQEYRPSSKLAAVGMLLLTLAIVPLGIRGTLGHRPLNPSLVAFCNNPLVNSLPSNSSYNAVYALAHLHDSNLGSENIFAILPEEKTLSVLDEFSTRTAPATVTPECPINQELVPWSKLAANSPIAQGMSALHRAAFNASETPATSAPTPKRYNLVIILEESLGDNFVASQGGWPLTPNLDRLRQQGWFFDHMFAAGHRSIRGIEAVTASMPPSPLPSIVDLPFGTQPYATIMELCQCLGYVTSFIYGGESHFDNMRDYFFSNGTKKVFDQNNYPNPSFVAAWGVSDEDLFTRANGVFKRSYGLGEHFCSVIFTSSFHDPFDIPQGKVSITPDELALMQTTARDAYDGMPERLLAAKYADYALGRYFEMAQQEEYFKDTIFLVIADHESRVAGSNTFPFNDFTIPAVILAPNVAPYIDKRVVSQIDMTMTLLSLMGFAGEIPNVGQNLLRLDIKERAPMQFNNVFGYYDGHNERFVQLTPLNEPAIYEVQRKSSLTNPQPLQSARDHELVDAAVRIENLGPLLYQKQYLSSSCAHILAP